MRNSCVQRAISDEMRAGRSARMASASFEERRPTMSQRTLRISVLATLLLLMGPVSAQTADEILTVRIENVSAKDALKLSNGKTEPVALAPVLYVIHTNRAPLFTSGEPDRGKGLEALAEDGSTGPLEKSLKGQPGIVSVGSTDTPVGASGPGDIEPGGAYEFKVTAKPGERLTIATMFVQSNDLFYAPREEGIALFDASGKPIRGDVTSQILLWDAGTEVNEEPGLGPNQAPLQAAPNTGPAEHGVVRPITEVKDGFHYPTVPEVLRVTITPGPAATR